MTDRILVRINRSRGGRGLFRESVFVGGKRTSPIKRGGSTSVSVNKQRVIFLQGEGSVRNNAVIFPSSEDEIALDIRLAGGLKTGFSTVFLPEGSDIPYPSVSFDRLFSGLEGNGTLNEAQRKLALLAFVMEAFDAEEILRSKHAGELVGTLKELGASQYAATLERVIAAQFSGFNIPIEGGEHDESMAERFGKAEIAICEADENGRLTEELARAAANYISSHYNELFTEEDVYRFDGSRDPRRFGAERSVPKRDRPKRRPDKKRIFKLALAAVIFLAVECGLFFLWRYSAYYPARAALPENTCTVTLGQPAIELEKGLGPHESDKIRFISGDETYTMVWSNKPARLGRDSGEFVKELEKEPFLTLAVRNGKTVCAVSGAEKTYMSIEDFNGYQRTQSNIGTALLAFFALLAAAAFAGAVFVIRH